MFNRSFGDNFQYFFFFFQISLQTGDLVQHRIKTLTMQIILVCFGFFNFFFHFIVAFSFILTVRKAEFIWHYITIPTDATLQDRPEDEFIYVTKDAGIIIR